MKDKEQNICAHCAQNPVNHDNRSGLSDYWLRLLPLLRQQNINHFCHHCLHEKAKLAIDRYEHQYFAGELKNHASDFSSGDGQFVEGIDYYREGEFFVFTSWYHLKRGYCCGSGCRHCPYTKKKKIS